jgi:hypothetical protein
VFETADGTTPAGVTTQQGMADSTSKDGSFTTETPDAIRVLVTEWNDLAREFRYRGVDEGLARSYELCAQQLRAALAAQDSRLLSVSEAAALTGRHRDTISKALGSGRLTNYGAKYRPRVRYADVLAQFPPQSVARPAGVSYDVAVDARAFLGTRRGERV